MGRTDHDADGKFSLIEGTLTLVCDHLVNEMFSIQNGR